MVKAALILFHGIHCTANNISTWFHPFTGNQLTKGQTNLAKIADYLLSYKAISSH